MSSPSKSHHRGRTSGARRTSRSAVATAPPKRVAADAAIDRDLAALAMDLALDFDADLDFDRIEPREPLEPLEPHVDVVSTEARPKAEGAIEHRPAEPAPAPSEAADAQATEGELSVRITAYLAKSRARVVLTDNLHTMVSIKRGHGVLTFRVHHMFVAAPPSVVRALARYAEQQDRDSARLLRSFIDSNETRIRRRAEPRPLSCDVEGRYHHLQEIFDDLNARYFQGAIGAQITWGPRGRRRRRRGSIKLGSYTCEDALIRIHPVLDARDVPRFFVEWIVYHEMLHEIYDMPVIDGRRVYHTPEFRRAEARFDRYAEAVLWERTNLHKLLDR